MANSAAIRRLKKEYATLDKEPAPGSIARPLETNFLHAHFLLFGEVFYDTPYEGGVYHGVLKFPSNYPLKPPSVIMRTPSGRFQPNEKICFSLSDFHPELWSPMWNIRSILTALVSFMNSDEITTGGVSAPDSHRIELAKKSLGSCLEQDPLARELFGSELEGMLKERENLGGSWPPTRLAPKSGRPPATKIDSAPARKADNASSKMLHSKERVDSKAVTSAPSPPSSDPGKNAAKNKKKREREKRKKHAKRFLASIAEQVPRFVENIETSLLQIGMEVSQYHADHVCWRTDTVEEYDELVSALKSSSHDCTLLVESEIGGRPIATISLAEGIHVGDRLVDVVEIPSPKDGSPYKSGLEHVEFVIDGTHDPPPSPLNDALHQSALSELMENHPGLKWNIKGKDKKINPDVSLKVELNDFGLCSVKFHLMALAKVIEYEKLHSTA